LFDRKAFFLVFTDISTFLLCPKSIGSQLEDNKHGIISLFLLFD